MECILADYTFTPGQTFNVTCYSDLHDDATACAHDQLKAHMERRAALSNPVFLGIGDTGNWIMPGQDRRHTPSTPLAELATRDDYIDAAIALQVERYKGYPWRMFGLGNHETSIINHHHTDPVRRLCDALNVPWGGYSGHYIMRFYIEGESTPRCKATILYHHGAGGGKVQKGFGWARDWGLRQEGWDVFVFGHNHYCHTHHETVTSPTERGKLRSRDVHFVNTGTFQRSMEQGSMPAYSEIKGYFPVALTSPLIQITPTLEKGGRPAISVTTGDC